MQCSRIETGKLLREVMDKIFLKPLLRTTNKSLALFKILPNKLFCSAAKLFHGTLASHGKID